MSLSRPGDIVVITGASSGLGDDAARTLGQAGYRVVAGYRSEGDGARLATLAGVESLLMDVVSPETLRRAAAHVDAVPGRLGGVVVNAGIAVAGPIELVDLDALTAGLQVNVVGAVATVQAFLPRLRRDRGRILLMSSVSGRRSAPVIGPYAASKYALEAIGDALRVEVRSQGIDVVIIEPGGVRTPIWRKTEAAGEVALEGADPAVVAHYRAMIDSVRSVGQHVDDHGLDPSDVSACIRRALEARRPRTRYALGERVGIQTQLLTRLLPDRAFDRLKMRALGLDRSRR